MGKIGKDTLAILLVFAILGVALFGSQIFSNHSEPKLSPPEKVQQGVYDPDAVLFAQHEIEQEIANGILLNSDSKGLELLAYLAEGALCFPGKVDSFRVRMLANAAQGSLESAPTLTDGQINSLTRIKNAMSGLEEQVKPSQVSQISAAYAKPDGTTSSSPVETSCR